MNSLKKKYGLIVKAFIIVLVLIALKAIFHFLNLEIVTVGPVITALVAGVFFVIAIILSGVLSDFKESERIPSELTASIDALYKDTMLTGNREATAGMLIHIKALVHTIVSNFERKGNWKISEVNGVIDQLDEDIRFLAEKDTPLALILKLRNELGNIKRASRWR
jgi:hypothetical protein